MLPIYLVVSCFLLPLQCRNDKEHLQIKKLSELLKRLRDAGCILSQHGSKHDKWINPKTGAYDYVPRHCKEVAKGTAIKVLKIVQGNSPCQSMSHVWIYLWSSFTKNINVW